MSSLKLMLFLPLAALCVPAFASQDTGSPQDSAPAQGMVVVRDAQTGKLRTPTAAEIRAIQQQAPSGARVAPPQATMVTGPGGRRSVRLGENHMVYSVVNRDSEGKLGEQCVHGAHAAERAATQPATKHEEHRHESR